MLGTADPESTRAITICAEVDQGWPWIAQLGQERAGFYSYDVLENLIGCDIHSADVVVPDWQRVEVGDLVKLAPELPLTVALVDPGEALVLRGGVPIGSGSPPPYDFTWAFVLGSIPGQDGAGGASEIRASEIRAVAGQTRGGVRGARRAVGATVKPCRSTSVTAPRRTSAPKRLCVRPPV